MISALVSRFVILVFGTLYPAYASYKTIKTRNTKEYLKWMMYWVIFALFTCAETVADLFVCWLPFYYEIKIIFVVWLLSPATQGSKILYKKIVHRQFSKHEEEIDEYLKQASDKGYSALLSVGSRGLSYATNVVLTTAIKGQNVVADHIRRAQSLNDVTDNQQLLIENYEDDQLMEDNQNMLKESFQGSPVSEIKRSKSEMNSVGDDEPNSENDAIEQKQNVDSGYATLPRAASRRSARNTTTKKIHH